MHAKKMDKLATGVLYTIAGIIVAILASLILYILVRGLPHVSWKFLTGQSSSYQAGGGIGIQLYNSLFLLVITLIISIPLSKSSSLKSISFIPAFISSTLYCIGLSSLRFLCLLFFLIFLILF